MPVQAVSQLYRAYGIKTWLKMFYTLLAGSMLAGGAFIAFAPAAGGRNSPNLIIALVLLVLSGCFFAWMMLARVVIDGNRISVRNLVGERSAGLEQIDGFRTVSTRNGRYTLLVLKDGSRPITVSNAFDLDDDYRAWLAQLTDFDQRSRQKLLDQIAQDAELGDTPAERLAALSQAKLWGIAAIVLTVAAAAGLDFGPAGLHETCMVMLAIAPVLALILLQRSPLLFSLMKRKADPRADLSLVLVVAGIGLFFRVQRVELVSTQALLMIAIPVAVVFIAAFLNVALHNVSPAGGVIFLLIMAGLYSYGLTLTVDAIGDDAPTQVFTAQVVGKHISSGRSTSYYLHLNAWGPVQQAEAVHVSLSLYRATAVGDQACLALHPGSLHIQWYQVVDCRYPTRNGLTP